MPIVCVHQALPNVAGGVGQVIHVLIKMTISATCSVFSLFIFLGFTCPFHSRTQHKYVFFFFTLSALYSTSPPLYIPLITFNRRAFILRGAASLKVTVACLLLHCTCSWPSLKGCVLAKNRTFIALFFKCVYLVPCRAHSSSPSFLLCIGGICSDGL